MLISVSEMKVPSKLLRTGVVEADAFSEARAGIPVSEQRRFDVYKDVNE